VTPEQLTQIGVAGLLAVIVIAFYTDRVETKRSCDNRVAIISQMWAERFADVTVDRDGWKAQALQLAPAVEKLADELEERNALDEQRQKALDQAQGRLDQLKT